MLSFKQRITNKVKYYFRRGVMLSSTFYWDEVIDERRIWFKSKQFRKDRRKLKKLYRKINRFIGIKFKHLYEIRTFSIEDADALKAIADSVEGFELPFVRIILVYQLCSNKVKGSAEIALRELRYYKSVGDTRALPMYYYLYDNAFRITKPKRLKKELVEVVANDPSLASSMGLTMRLLAKWQAPGLEDVLVSYLDIDSISGETLITKWEEETQEDYEARIRRCKYALLFRSLDLLKYFPSERNIEILRQFTEYNNDYFTKDEIKGVRSDAKEAIEYIEKKSAQSPAAQTTSN